MCELRSEHSTAETADQCKHMSSGHAWTFSMQASVREHEGP